MKTYLLIGCSLLLFGIAQAQFEGEIDMKMTRHNGDEKFESPLTLLMKGELLSFTVPENEASSARGTIIFRPDKNVLWILSPKEKTYLEIVPDKEMAKGKISKKPKSKTKSQTNFKKTGKTATVAGYDCEEWIDEDGEDVTNVWGTTKLGNVYEGFLKALSQWGASREDQNNEDWQNELITRRIFPMKTVVKEDGKITETQEVTKVEKRSLPASAFEPPSGYKKQALDMDMGKMMKGLKDGMKGGNARSMNKEDLEKMMKKLQENMDKDSEEQHDSTDKDDDDDE